MRTSKRDSIVAGALELAHRDGFDTLTFDVLAEHVEALTRSVVDGEILPGEVSFMLSATPEAEMLKDAWNALRREWVGEISELTSMQRVALLAVDGWWANRAVDSDSQDPDDPEIAELIVSLAAGNVPDQVRDRSFDKD
ncbi:TetR family transcriptional regulator [Actinomyces naeslundii]|uniref:TetR family transcriptional regulator n=1 Tax=Actinomyces naeslundii TaxID=1655 RepID=UPI00096C7207|nr:TetR family transcriptional regulator [Actinomyces naeslundii]OMG11364.1 TetR family transcriptional regulator [Actinomyces naeslundii]